MIQEWVRSREAMSHEEQARGMRAQVFFLSSLPHTEPRKCLCCWLKS